MNRKIICLCMLIPVLLSVISCTTPGPLYEDDPITPPAGFKVVGYTPDWVSAPESIQYSKLTHINYAFTIPDSAGALSGINGTNLTSIVTLAHAAGVKVLISVGGWNDGDDSGFEALSDNPAIIDTFVSNCESMVSTYSLDGVDIDYSAVKYNALITALSTSMQGLSKLCTAAVIAEGSTGDMITSTTWDHLDFITIMA